MMQLCPKCKAECEGEDLGDHPCYLSFCCDECGHTFDYNSMADMVDAAMMMREDQ